MSIAEYLINSRAHAADYVGLPVYPSRAFRSSSIFVRTDRISDPKHLCRSRIGVPLYGMTAAVYARGFLSDEYAVNFGDSDWIQGAMNSPSRLILALASPVLPKRRTFGIRQCCRSICAPGRLPRGYGRPPRRLAIALPFPRSQQAFRIANWSRRPCARKRTPRPPSPRCRL